MQAKAAAPKERIANATPHWIQSGTMRLRALQWGTTGPGVLLLHGLTGRAATWAKVAPSLARGRRVVALDQRGHGDSGRAPGHYGSADFADDAAQAIKALDLAPAVVIGHSMGALNAVVLAARHPDLVRAVILEDQSVATNGRGEGRELAEWMKTWPVPFPDEKALRTYFDAAGFGPAVGPFELASMKTTSRGLVPVFDLAEMAEVAAEWDTRSYWEELERIRAPVLVLRGAKGMYPREEHEEMARRAQDGRFVEISGAQHFVHWDRTDAYLAACEAFIGRLPSPAGAAVSPKRTPAASRGSLR